MEKMLIIIGAAIFGILGTTHLFYTYFRNEFDPRDEAVKSAMQKTSPVITSDTTIWKGWIGFHASHSIGAILVAAFYIPLTISYLEVIENSKWFSILLVIIGFSYLIMASRYWFRVPFIGFLISTVCFIGAALLLNT